MRAIQCKLEGDTLIYVVEVDRNRNFLAGTRNLPGMRFPVPGFEIYDLPGYWFGYWF